MLKKKKRVNYFLKTSKEPTSPPKLTESTDVEPGNILEGVGEMEENMFHLIQYSGLGSLTTGLGVKIYLFSTYALT